MQCGSSEELIRLLYLCVKPQDWELSLCLQMKSWPWANHFIAFCFPFPSCSTLAGDIQACMHPHLHRALSLKGATEKSKCCHFPSRALGTSACSVSKSCARADIWISEVQITHLYHWHLITLPCCMWMECVSADCASSYRALELEIFPEISWCWNIERLTWRGEIQLGLPPLPGELCADTGEAYGASAAVSTQGRSFPRSVVAAGSKLWFCKS